MTRILIVDDNGSIRRILSEILETRNYNVRAVGSGRACLKTVTEDSFDLILLDIKMQGMDGLEVLGELNLMNLNIPIIMMSAHGRSGTAKAVMLKGAYNYIEKPFDTEELFKMIENALEPSSLEGFDTGIPLNNKRKLGKNSVAKPKMIGSCSKFLLLKKQIERMAPTDFRVLIKGPNGAGKELVARSIHDLSPRKKKRFVEVNCAAIPSELIESVLFGHTKGSFTGATKETVGLFQQAEGGTIFLDEIGDMSPSAQAKVLRVLQENKITKVGGDREIKIDVRVLAATNKDLPEMILAKTFREDLYYRLEELVIEVPSLNERRADIPDLVNYFIKRIADRSDWIPPTIEKEAMDALQQLNYPGNIRQLQNIIKRILVMSEKTVTVLDVNQLAPPVVSQQTETIEFNNLVKSLGGSDAAITYIRERFKDTDQ